MSQAFRNRIEIEELKLIGAYINYQSYPDSSNFKFLTDYFLPPPKDGTREKASMQLDVKRIEIVHSHLVYGDNTKRRREAGVDFSHLDITGFSGSFDHIDWKNSIKRVRVKDLTLKEKSGFYLAELSTDISIGDTFMEFDDLHLRTDRSQLRDYLRFDYSKTSDFGEFINKVHLTSRVSESFVDSEDIEFFAPLVSSVHFKAGIERASLSGTVSDIAVKQARVKTGKSTVLEGDFEIKGLPDMEHTLFDFKLHRLITNAAETETIVAQLANREDFELPHVLHRLEDVRYNGKVRGLYHDFELEGSFETVLGRINTTLAMDVRRGLSYQGAVFSKSFDIGTLFQIPVAGKTGVDIAFSGRELSFDSLRLDAAGSLRGLQLKNQVVEDVGFDMEVAGKRIKAQGAISDSDAELAYDIIIDLQDGLPKYTVQSDIDHLNLSAYGFVKKDSVLVRKTNLKANLAGLDINTVTGFIEAPHINVYAGESGFRIEDFCFSAIGDQRGRMLKLTSNALDMEMRGVVDLSTILPYFRSVAMQYAPAIGFEKEWYGTQQFDLDIRVKSFEPIAAFWAGEVGLSDGASLTASFSSDMYLAQFEFSAPEVRYRNMRADNVVVTEDADQGRLVLDVAASRFYFSDSLYAEKLHVRNILANDSLLFSVNIASDSAANYLRLNGDIHFVHEAPAAIRFDDSDIVLANEKWAINSDSRLSVSKGRFFLDNLVFSQGVQKVAVNGVLSGQDDKLTVDFHRFGLLSLEALTNPLGIRLRGEVSGSLEINSVFRSPNFSANIITTPIIYNDLPIGQLSLGAYYRPEMGGMDVHLDLRDDLERGMGLKGTVHLSDEQSLRLEGEMNNMDIVIFQPFLRTLSRDMAGRMSGNLSVGGTISTPTVTGEVSFDQAAFTVIYLNTAYSIHDQDVRIENNVVHFEKFSISDKHGHIAVANGFLDLNRLSDPLVDLSVSAQNFLVLNTTYKENNLYYGTAYASGVFAFKGRTSGINIDINATSDPNTVIHIPFNAAMTVSESDFIYFIGRDSNRQGGEESRFFLKGLTMNMNLQITPDAEINLQTDIGSLKGIGRGELQLRISSLGDFEMFGSYAVSSGKFHFTAHDFINKYFDIKEGGTVRWTGDPSEATINLTAVYQQRTAVGALYNSAGRPGQDERVLAQADMIISGTLSSPDISFDLNFPLNPYIKDELQAYLSDANNVNQQALSLIVRRSFTASTASEFGREVNSTLLSAGTEIAFNQLNTIISQSLNINFLDLNIRSFNDASASLRLFGDRLVLTGGISDQRNLRNTDLTFFSNQVVTDAELTYRIRRDGSLMFRAYNRLNTRNILFTPTDDYINAAGLVYRQEFNTFGEFFRRMMFFRRIKMPVSEALESGN